MCTYGREKDYSIQIQDDKKFLFNWSGKIKKFHVICIYENNHLDMDEFTSQLEKETPKILTALQTFKEFSNTTTYIIWDEAYQVNKNLSFPERRLPLQAHEGL